MESRTVCHAVGLRLDVDMQPTPQELSRVRWELTPVGGVLVALLATRLSEPYRAATRERLLASIHS